MEFNSPFGSFSVKNYEIKKRSYNFISGSRNNRRRNILERKKNQLLLIKKDHPMEVSYQKTSVESLKWTSDRNEKPTHTTDLSRFDTRGYRGGPRWRMMMWYPLQYYLFDTALPIPYAMKRWLLRLFGARVGKGVIIKPNVRIKYPWRLVIGDHSWIGESVWIDNLLDVRIGSNVALSQGAMLLTGNHDYSDPTFPYRLGEIVLEDGVWIGARAIVCPTVVCRSHSVLMVSAVATKHLEPWGIYAGNPAKLVRQRKFTHEPYRNSILHQH